MYERFTDRARKVMRLANEEALELNHESIDSEHVLLGLIKEGSGVAASVLKYLDLDVGQIRLEVERLAPGGPDNVIRSLLPQAPGADQVVELSLEEARSLNHNYVGTEHLLLGLLRVDAGLATKVLANLGLAPDQVRQEVLNLLGHGIDTAE